MPAPMCATAKLLEKSGAGHLLPVQLDALSYILILLDVRTNQLDIARIAPKTINAVPRFFIKSYYEIYLNLVQHKGRSSNFI
jgi:hypothetical protein